jgi:arsenate reductase
MLWPDMLSVESQSGDTMHKVIFACVHNAGRSQMAAAFFNQLADPQKAEAVSAGTEPGLQVHPVVLAVMQEVGVDLSNAKPQKLTEELAREAQLLVTMGCGDKCPYVPGLRRDDWPLRDPKGLSIEQVRTIRDGIKNRVQLLLSIEGLEKPSLQEQKRPNEVFWEA